MVGGYGEGVLLPPSRRGRDTVSPAGSVGIGKAPPALNVSPHPLLNEAGENFRLAASVGPGRCPLGTRTPLAPPASGGKQELSCRLGDFAGLGVTHPLPPPVRGMGGGEWLVCAGGGNLFYTSHFKGGGSRLPPRSAMDGRHWRPSPPFGTPVRACLTPVLFFFFGLLKGWTRLPHSGRCHRRAMTERASSKFRRAKPRGIFLSSPATGRKNRGLRG